jgi:hypothetical protein
MALRLRSTAHRLNNATIYRWHELKLVQYAIIVGVVEQAGVILQDKGSLEVS